MTRTNVTEARTKEASELLVGKTIVSVRYMTADELQEVGWGCNALVVELSDGTLVWPIPVRIMPGPGLAPSKPPMSDEEYI